MDYLPLLIVAEFCLKPAFCSACSPEDITVNATGTYASTNFTWSVGIPYIEITVNFFCHVEVEKAYTFYFVNDVNVHKPVDIWRESHYAYVYERRCNTFLDVAIDCQADIKHTQVHLNVSNPTAYDRMRFAVVDYYNYSVLMLAPALTFKNCSLSELPEDLKTGSQADFSYSEVIAATCSSGYMFIYDAYIPHAFLTCGPYAAWVLMHSYTCENRCKAPTDPHLVTASTARTDRYRTGTVLSLTCAGSLMFVMDNPKYYVESLTVVCAANGQWDKEVMCWTGRTVDFSSYSATITAGIPTVFACKSDGVSSSIRIGSEVVAVKKVNAWVNMTLESKHNTMTAQCDVIYDGNRAIPSRKTKLNVLYSPEAPHGHIHVRLVVGEPGTAVLKIRANPAFTSQDVKLSKNGTDLPNFFVTRNGERHEIVVHFTQVQENDLGEYVIRVTSYTPVAAVLEVIFTVEKAIDVQIPDLPDTSEHSSQDNTVIALATCLGLVIAGAVVAVLSMWRRSARDKPKSSEPKPVEPVVRYQPDEPEVNDALDHSYEDIDKPSTNTDHEAYENVNHGPTGHPVANLYTPEEPGRHNGGGRVAMMPGRTNKPLGQTLPQAQRPRGRADAYRPGGPQYNVEPDLHGQMEGYERMEFNPGF